MLYKKEIIKPLLGILEKGTFEEALENGLSGYEVISSPKAPKMIEKSLLDSVKFTKVDFSMAKILSNDISNAVFENCNLTWQVLSKTRLCKCLFTHCRLDGVSFMDSLLENVTFIGCSVQSANFSLSNFKSVLFEESRLDGSFFSETKIGHLSLTNSTMKGIEVIRTSLKGVDLSTCSIEGMMADFDSLRGATLSSEQAISVLGMLGIKVVG